MATLDMQVVGEVPDGPSLKALVDTEIAEFDQAFQRELQNEPLVNVEKSILSTYLWWKCRRILNDNQESAATQL